MLTISSEITAILFGSGLDILEICLRLLCAMVVGLVIGTEREYTNRPAGMRTHILVALGACVITLTGEMIFHQYKPLGGDPDPARLSAQVVTGVGFLGAGTIMREGASVKGLTTAASVWAVACLGIASGFGYYAIALTGMVFIFVTLTLFEVIQNKLMGAHAGIRTYIVETEMLSDVLQGINNKAQSSRAELRNLQTEQLPGGIYRITFRAEFFGGQARKRQLKFFEDLASMPNVRSAHVKADTAAIK